MKTILKTAPGMWEVRSTATNPKIPAGHMRVATVTFEVYELEGTPTDLDTQFTLLAAKSQESEEMLRLLLSLRDHLVVNFGYGKCKPIEY